MDNSTHTIECYSAIRKNEIMPFATTWVDLEIIIGRERSQTGKDKYRMTARAMESKLLTQMNSSENRNRLRDRADVGLPRGECIEEGRSGSLGLADAN